MVLLCRTHALNSTLFTIVSDQSKVDPGPHSPIQIPKKGLGLGTIVRNSASVASFTAKTSLRSCFILTTFWRGDATPQMLLNGHIVSMGIHFPGSFVQGEIYWYITFLFSSSRYWQVALIALCLIFWMWWFVVFGLLFDWKSNNKKSSYAGEVGSKVNM